MRAAIYTLFAFAVFAPGRASAEGEPAAWIAESNRHSQLLLDEMARYNPEDAAGLGVEGHDGEVIDLKPHVVERQKASLEGALGKLEAARASAADPLVRQDLDILVTTARQQIESLQLRDRLMLPYFSVAELLFNSFHDLLDERIPKARQASALMRLQRYAGSEPGYAPAATLARALIEKKLEDSGLTFPWSVEVEQDLKNEARYIKGIRDLLVRSGLEGWRKDFGRLERQIKAYDAWVRETILPRARETNRLPPEIYADNLKNFGVTMTPHELIDRALLAYAQTREDLVSVSKTLAAQRNWESPDYRDVIRELKKQRVPDDRLLALYRGRLEEIESIVREQNLVSLPTRDAVIRLGNEAESTAQPAPHLDPPRLIGNTGEPAEFVLPTANPNARAGVEMDDFNYDSIAWALTAHEARPGHELQFARMIEHGVSTARVVFAFNSANVEGWALYSESIMRPYLPPEAQIGVLQMRLMRAARAFLDPMLNLGLIEPAAAQRLLMEEVVLSEPMAKQEVDRYTFRAPGQATSYFFGYSKLSALRVRAELTLGPRFDAKAYHDFIVNEGLLPLDLLEKAVMEQFVAAGVPRQRGGSPSAESAAPGSL